MDDKPIDWEKVTEERRGKILWIPHRRLLDALVISTQTATRITRVALPKHYHLRSVHYEPSRGSFGFFIESPEYQKTPIGAELPDFAQGEVEEVMIEIEKKGKKVNGVAGLPVQAHEIYLQDGRYREHI